MLQPLFVLFWSVNCMQFAKGCTAILLENLNPKPSKTWFSQKKSIKLSSWKLRSRTDHISEKTSNSNSLLPSLTWNNVGDLGSVTPIQFLASPWRCAYRFSSGNTSLIDLKDQHLTSGAWQVDHPPIQRMTTAPTDSNGARYAKQRLPRCRAHGKASST